MDEFTKWEAAKEAKQKSRFGDEVRYLIDDQASPDRDGHTYGAKRNDMIFSVLFLACAGKDFEELNKSSSHLSS